MSTVNFKIARSSMKLISEASLSGYLEAVGVSQDDFDKLTGNNPWIGTDRVRMKRALDSLLASTMDVINVPRFEVPAEYVAATIAMFVAPINYHPACRFAEVVNTAEDLGRGVAAPEQVSAKQLFALVCQLHDNDCRTNAHAVFAKKTGLIIAKGNQTEEEKKLKK